MRSRVNDALRELKGQIRALEKELRKVSSERDQLAREIMKIADPEKVARKAKTEPCPACGSDKLAKVTLSSISGIPRVYLRCKACKFQIKIPSASK